mmetsp:Transcript_95772/g.298265  ORF Transcript_95772/g.298265 Transcript_95772/m.298265 type:complete len:315 (+) Transcript_95772:1508-2452(+)
MQHPALCHGRRRLRGRPRQRRCQRRGAVHDHSGRIFGVLVVSDRPFQRVCLEPHNDKPAPLVGAGRRARLRLRLLEGAGPAREQRLLDERRRLRGPVEQKLHVVHGDRPALEHRPRLPGDGGVHQPRDQQRLGPLWVFRRHTRPPRRRAHGRHGQRPDDEHLGSAVAGTRPERLRLHALCGGVEAGRPGRSMDLGSFGLHGSDERLPVAVHRRWAAVQHAGGLPSLCCLRPRRREQHVEQRVRGRGHAARAVGRTDGRLVEQRCQHGRPRVLGGGRPERLQLRQVVCCGDRRREWTGGDSSGRLRELALWHRLL